MPSPPLPAAQAGAAPSDTTSSASPKDLAPPRPDLKARVGAPPSEAKAQRASPPPQGVPPPLPPQAPPPRGVPPPLPPQAPPPRGVPPPLASEAPQESEGCPPPYAAWRPADEWCGVAALYQADESESAFPLCDEERRANLEAQAEERTALEAIYAHELRVVRCPTHEILELRIAVELPPPLAVELPASLSSAARGLGVHAEPLAAGQLPLDSLPPLTLRVRFVRAYPSRAPPPFALRCCWLSDAQLESLAAALDAQWDESPGAVVVSLWAEWLRSESAAALAPLRLHPLRLPREEAAEDGRVACGSRAARWPRGGALVLAAVVRHARQAAEGEWKAALHACAICLETYASLDCVRFVRCAHTFCRPCVGGYFASQLAGGAATALLCPDPRCRVAATPPEVKQLIPPDLYERYEKQLLQASLDEMQDVVWCPRCEYPALQDPANEGQSSVLATCAKCAFCFCSECRQSWHGLAPCANLAQRWRAADEAGREALRRRYGDKVMEEVQSGEWMLENTKACPRCSTKIQKNGGCNHITCRNCNHEWCWLCGARYEQGHFKTGNCEQFSQDFFDEVNLTREEFEGNYVVLNHW
ncbi:hypothetical protein AB1Y20_020487 [Prymnesium parvum]|uniref:RBR-type E3 ubiquitin transferase n=1 Tax=Prymnesium parvum TaxID=97485 RepID=A0AB34JV91_PRYPA